MLVTNKFGATVRKGSLGIYGGASTVKFLYIDRGTGLGRVGKVAGTVVLDAVPPVAVRVTGAQRQFVEL